MSDLISRKDLIDLISRDKAIDALELQIPFIIPNRESPRVTAMRIINCVPSAHFCGEWLDDKDDYGVVCSICSHWQRDKSAYCPDCGSDMRGKEVKYAGKYE